MNAAMTALALAGEGVTWKKGKGAVCPACGKKLKVGSKQGDVRYCYCKTPTCLICATGIGIKALPE